MLYLALSHHLYLDSDAVKRGWKGKMKDLDRCMHELIYS